MPYFRAPAERPRKAKRFLTSREVEDMAAAGHNEIVHQDDMVITDAARETAHDLGVRIVKPDAASPSRAANPAQAAVAPPDRATPGASAASEASAPLAPPTTAPVRTPASVDPLVQALVHAMRARKG